MYADDIILFLQLCIPTILWLTAGGIIYEALRWGKRQQAAAKQRFHHEAHRKWERSEIRTATRAAIGWREAT